MTTVRLQEIHADQVAGVRVVFGDSRHHKRFPFDRTQPKIRNRNQIIFYLRQQAARLVASLGRKLAGKFILPQAGNGCACVQDKIIRPALNRRLYPQFHTILFLFVIFPVQLKPFHPYLLACSIRAFVQTEIIHKYPGTA